MASTKIQVYKDAAGEWRWRLRSANGQIIASSGEGYARKSYAIEAGDEAINGPDDFEIELED